MVSEMPKDQHKCPCGDKHEWKEWKTYDTHEPTGLYQCVKCGVTTRHGRMKKGRK